MRYRLTEESSPLLADAGIFMRKLNLFVSVSLMLFVLFAIMQSTTIMQSIDAAMLLTLRTDDISIPRGTSWLLPLMSFLTYFGDVEALALVCLVVLLLLLLYGRKDEILLFVFAALGGIVLTFAMKAGFARPRPTIVQPLAIVTSYSFPSGHASITAAVYVPVLLILRRRFSRASVLLTLSILLFLLLIGFSRIYLGVHYASDVLAGWAIIASWLGVCVSVIGRVR